MKRSKFKIHNLILMTYEENKKSSLLIYIVLRILVIACMILQILRGDLNNALLCLLSLFLLFAPLFIQKKFKITIPDGLEISIYLFIFSAGILGEINNFYKIIPFWDIILHSINGFLSAAVGFSIIDLLNRNSKTFNLSPVYLCIVAFCFSMTIGVLWEFYEYSLDKIFLTDMQKDQLTATISSVALNPDGKNKANIIKGICQTVLYDKHGKTLAKINGGYLDIGINDTMKDMFVNFIGGFVFSILGYFSLKGNKNSFIYNFVPKCKKRKITKSVNNKIKKLNIEDN